MKLLAALTALTSAIDPLMLMMMSGGMGGGGMDIGSNPILLLQLLKGDSGSSGLKDLLPLMMMSGGKYHTIYFIQLFTVWNKQQFMIII